MGAMLRAFNVSEVISAIFWGRKNHTRPCDALPPLYFYSNRNCKYGKVTNSIIATLIFQLVLNVLFAVSTAQVTKIYEVLTQSISYEKHLTVYVCINKLFRTLLRQPD